MKSCFRIVVLQYFTILLGICSGRLVQVIHSHPCLGDEVEYECVDDQLGILIWEIARENSVTHFHASFGAQSGREAQDRIGSSTIKANLIYGNSSHLYSVLTITRVTPLADYMLRCNEERVILRDSLVSTDNQQRLILPQFIFIVKRSLDYLFITWSSVSTNYNITITLNTGPLVNKTSNELYIPINSGNSSYVLTFHVCQVTAVFALDSYIFNELNLTIMNQYIVYSNGTAQVTCHNNEMITVNSTCSENSTCNHKICLENERNTSLNVQDMQPTVFRNTLPNKLTNVASITPQLLFTTMNTEDNNKTNEITGNTLNLLIILLSSIVPGGIILLLLFIVLIAVTITVVYGKKKSKISSDNLSVSTNNENSTYAPLSNHHYLQGHQQKIPHAIKLNNCSASTYSLLLYEKPTLRCEDDYSTIQTAKPKQYSGANYAEIKTCHNCGSSKTLKEDLKVRYAKILVETSEHDDSLNLDTLMMQLRPISDCYQLFGSVAGISPVTINNIVAKTNSSYDSMTEICDLWLKKCEKEGIKPTWRAVADILHLIGYNELSLKIMQIYSTEKLSSSDLISVQNTKKLPDVCQTFLPASPSPVTSDKKQHDRNSEISESEISPDSSPPPILPYKEECFKEDCGIGESNQQIPLYATVQVKTRHKVHQDKEDNHLFHKEYNLSLPHGD